MRILQPFMAVVMTAACAAWAQDGTAPAPRFNIKEEEPRIGSNIRQRAIDNSLVPTDKTYEQLTPEQKSLFKSQYEQLGPADEPPFPLYGLGPMYKAISAVHQKLLAVGDLTLFVEIDSAGHATSVSVLQSPDAKLTQAVANILMLQAYKPAICAGQPCKMQFPLRMKLTKTL